MIDEPFDFFSRVLTEYFRVSNVVDEPRMLILSVYLSISVSMTWLSSRVPASVASPCMNPYLSVTEDTTLSFMPLNTRMDIISPRLGGTLMQM